MEDLRPNELIQKALISTTSRFVGEFKSDNLLITHAWPDSGRIQSQVTATENPLCRNAFVVVFRTLPIDKKPGRIVHNYGPSADILCSYLSVLYGKRFDSHGLLESIGLFFRPDMTLDFSLCAPSLPQNSHAPRKDLEIPLNLEEFGRIGPLVLSDGNLRFHQVALTAAQFYQQALQNFESHPETAYLNLITSGEVLSGFYEYPKEDLLDEAAKEILQRIINGMEDGENVAKQIAARLHQVKRKFLKTIVYLINSYFFEHTESIHAIGALRQDDFEQRIAAAYDLRSKYVHTGIPFGGWVSRITDEIHIGTPMIKDKEYQKVITRAPTYFGLERIIRFCLLRFIHLNGVKIDSYLD